MSRPLHVAGTVAALSLLLAACVTPKPLPLFGQVPDFQLTDQTGRAFDGKSLNGHVWVADFIYTTCTGPCPMMSADMRRVQSGTSETPGVALVSFTVDPEHDTPVVLADYAKHFRADPGRWFFLTGDQARLNDVALNGFHLNSVDGSLTHSTRFALVDRRRRVRGYYVSSDDNFLLHLLHDIRLLAREPS